MYARVNTIIYTRCPRNHFQSQILEEVVRESGIESNRIFFMPDAFITSFLYVHKIMINAKRFNNTRKNHLTPWFPGHTLCISARTRELALNVAVVLLCICIAIVAARPHSLSLSLVRVIRIIGRLRETTGVDGGTEKTGAIVGNVQLSDTSGGATTRAHCCPLTAVRVIIHLN